MILNYLGESTQVLQNFDEAPLGFLPVVSEVIDDGFYTSDSSSRLEDEAI
ncbi:MAG: hypothetical protein Q6361_02600 [Candidatus Hermodarchaeota archaeon]|nr:hypothetical protein [Candidatus Hermodarchaeota archaeon]